MTLINMEHAVWLTRHYGYLKGWLNNSTESRRMSGYLPIESTPTNGQLLSVNIQALILLEHEVPNHSQIYKYFYICIPLCVCACACVCACVCAHEKQK